MKRLTAGQKLPTHKMQAELDHQFMQEALEQAKLAALAGEVPVGAV